MTLAFQLINFPSDLELSAQNEGLLSRLVKLNVQHHNRFHL